MSMTRTPASHLVLAVILGAVLTGWGIASWPSPVVTDHRIQGIERDWGDAEASPRIAPPTPISLAASATASGAILLAASCAMIGFRTFRRSRRVYQ